MGQTFVARAKNFVCYNKDCSNGDGRGGTWVLDYIVADLEGVSVRFCLECIGEMIEAHMKAVYLSDYVDEPVPTQQGFSSNRSNRMRPESSIRFKGYEGDRLICQWGSCLDTATERVGFHDSTVADVCGAHKRLIAG